jgi:cytochrome o ubiquinol oxidase subunit 1
MKHSKSAETKQPAYEPIRMPKNTPAGLIIAAFAFVFGFAVIWHIWWLAVIGLLGVLTTIIIRLSSDDTERTISANEVAKIESEIARGRQFA